MPATEKTLCSDRQFVGISYNRLIGVNFNVRFVPEADIQEAMPSLRNETDDE